MGQTTIEWTATYNDDGTVTPGFTFNPWQGCIKISPGCANCYALTLSNRWGKDVWGPGPKRQRTSAANWKKPLQWNKQAANEGKRFKVFCASMADVFEDNPQLNDWRSDLWDLIELTPNLDWLLLTKRPENVLRMTRRWTPENYGPEWPANIWLGTSVENQEYADKRIPELLKIPAKIRFLSMEPLLGPVDIGRWLCCPWCGEGKEAIQDSWGEWYHPGPIARPCPTPETGRGAAVKNIDWVIVGGESGHRARPLHPAWVRSLRDQCQGAGVAFFFKQWGEYVPDDHWTGSIAGHRPHFWPGHIRFASLKVGKHAAGRQLYGVEYSQFPQVEAEQKYYAVTDNYTGGLLTVTTQFEEDEAGLVSYTEITKAQYDEAMAEIETEAAQC